MLLGGTVPLTGEAAAFGTVGAGARAYFDYVNARGGVHGLRIEYRTYDDAYNPVQTVQQTRKLVEEDRVFAVFSSVGTATNLAIREYLNARKVPQLFAGDGSQAIGASFARYPWTMGFLMSYRGEGAVYGRKLVQTRPRASVAVLYENTELGRDMLTRLIRAIAGRGPRVVVKESYEFTGSEVSSQIARLKTSGADTLLFFATPKFFIQAVVAVHKLAWTPRLYIASVSIEPGIMAIARLNAPELTRGALSIAFVKNPNDPVWAKDRAVALYRTIMRKHHPSGRPSDVYHWYEMTVAWTMVETLRKTGRNLTRARLLQAARSLDLRGNPFLYRPGVGQVNAAGTVASPAQVAAGTVTAAARTRGKGATVSGTVRQGARLVQGPRSRSSAVRGRARSSASVASGRLRAGRSRSGAAPAVCTALSAAIAPVPCVNPTASGFTAQSRVVRKR